MKITIFLLVIVSCHASQEKDNEFAKAYLEKYAYTSYVSTFASSPDDVMRESLKDMQEYAGLEPTGELDPPTLARMHEKRCGLPDRDVNDNQLYGARRAPKRWLKNEVTYHFQNYSPDLGRYKTRSIIRAAFKIWSDASPLTFIECRDPAADIKILFKAGDHGCSKPFDGPGNTLAHAFPPLTGDVHFDEDEWFTDGTNKGINLLWVAAHEIGHALGLSHSSTPRALMYSKYPSNLDFGSRAYTKLHQADIFAMMRIYGMKGRPIPPPATAPCSNAAGGCFCAYNKGKCDDWWRTKSYFPPKSWKAYMTENCCRTCKRG